MKICDISSFYSDQGGGVRTYHLQKLAYFERHPEHEYLMIIAGPRNEVREVAGGRIYRVRGVSVSPKGGYRQLVDFPEIRRILRLERPDVIESGSAYLDCWLALAAGADWAPLFSGFYHADFPDSYMAPAVDGLPRAISKPFVDFWKRYVRFTYSRFDATCVTSRYIQSKLSGYGLRNTFLVPLGVDSEHFSPAKRDEDIRRQLGVREGEKLALYVGRFWSEKGIDVLTKAIPRLGAIEGLHVALVGDGTLEGQIKAAAAPFERVHVLGYVSDRDLLARIYASADLFLSPGPYETFGLSTVEALSSGVPVVAASTGGASESVGGSGAGMLFKAHDAGDFVRCVEVMLRADLEALGRRARRFVEESYSWDRTFQRMIAHYEELRHEKTARAAVAPRRHTGLRAADRESVVLSPAMGSPVAYPAGAARRAPVSRSVFAP
jgi:alpha-1,6-mannosyltransferase